MVVCNFLFSVLTFCLISASRMGRLAVCLPFRFVSALAVASVLRAWALNFSVVVRLYFPSLCGGIFPGLYESGNEIAEEVSHVGSCCVIIIPIIVVIVI